MTTWPAQRIVEVEPFVRGDDLELPRDAELRASVPAEIAPADLVAIPGSFERSMS